MPTCAACKGTGLTDVRKAAPCSGCKGAGYVPVDATEAPWPGQHFKLCPTCHASGGVRTPVADTRTLVAQEVSGERREAAKAAPRVSFTAAIAKRDSAYSALQQLAREERAIRGGTITPEAAMAKILRSPEGRRLYEEFDQGQYDAARAL
jgi:hypothetical protein